MSSIDLRSLVGRLNDTSGRALEAAAGFTLSRSHYDVEVEHWLLKLADIAGSDFVAILRHAGVDEGRLASDLNAELDRLKTGNARAPAWPRTRWRWRNKPGCSPRSSKAADRSAPAICCGPCSRTRR